MEDPTAISRSSIPARGKLSVVRTSASARDSTVDRTQPMPRAVRRAAEAGSGSPPCKTHPPISTGSGLSTSSPNTSRGREPRRPISSCSPKPSCPAIPTSSGDSATATRPLGSIDSVTRRSTSRDRTRSGLPVSPVTAFAGSEIAEVVELSTALWFQRRAAAASVTVGSLIRRPPDTHRTTRTPSCMAAATDRPCGVAAAGTCSTSPTRPVGECPLRHRGAAA